MSPSSSGTLVPEPGRKEEVKDIVGISTEDIFSLWRRIKQLCLWTRSGGN